MSPVFLVAVTLAAAASPDALTHELTEAIQARVLLEGVRDPQRRAEAEADTHWTTDEIGAVKIRDLAAERKTFKRDPAAEEKSQAVLRTIGLRYDPPADLTVLPLAADLAAVSYRLVQHTRFNDQPCTKVFRIGEVYRREGGRWKSVTRQETIIPGAPQPYRGDLGQWADYEGHYVLFPGHVYQVTRDRDRLWWGNDPARRVELVPEDAHTFVLNGREYYRVRFERDAAGKVTHLRMIEYPGVEYSAIKQEAGPAQVK